MRTNWLLVGTFSFGVAFTLGMVVERNLTKSAIIGGIATVSTLCVTYPLTRKYNQELVEREQKYINRSTKILQNLQSEINNFEGQKERLIYEINHQTQVKTTLESQYNLILTNLEKYQEINQLVTPDTLPKIDGLAEKDTPYAEGLLFIDKNFWSIYLYNIDCYKKEQRKVKHGEESLKRGEIILDSLNRLTKYIAIFGGMHYYKLEYLLQEFFIHLSKTRDTDCTLDIIDYGCGPALATNCFFDYLHSHPQNFQIEIDNITLVEPSHKALERGFLHLKHIGVSNNVKIRQIARKLQELNENDFHGISNPSNIKLHIFSNILDLSYFTSIDIENLYRVIVNSQSGLNYFICVSPHDGSGNIKNFYHLWEKNYQNHLKSIFLKEVGSFEKKVWFENSNQFKFYTIHRFHKLFYVNLPNIDINLDEIPF